MTKGPITGFPEAAYLLVIQPHEDLYQKIIQCKNEFAEKYNAAASTFGKPHITLLKFTQAEVAEDRLLRHLKSIAAASPPMQLELRDFGSFPSHTIYINLFGKRQLQQLSRDLKAAQKLMKGSEKPHFLSEPHITIARKLQPQQYEQAWKEYEHLSFSGRFIADHLMLLKKPAAGRSYQLLTRFDLLNNAPVATQGSLFF